MAAQHTLRSRLTQAALAGVFAAMTLAAAGDSADQKAPTTPPPADKAAAAGAQVVPEPKQVGGEPDGIVQVANLVYAGTKSSTCFSDHFLVQAEKDSKISTS